MFEQTLLSHARFSRTSAPLFLSATPASPARLEAHWDLTPKHAFLHLQAKVVEGRIRAMMEKVRSLPAGGDTAGRARVHHWDA